MLGGRRAASAGRQAGDISAPCPASTHNTGERRRDRARGAPSDRISSMTFSLAGKRNRRHAERSFRYQGVRTRRSTPPRPWPGSNPSVLPPRPSYTMRWPSGRRTRNLRAAQHVAGGQSSTVRVSDLEGPPVIRRAASTRAPQARWPMMRARVAAVANARSCLAMWSVWAWERTTVALSFLRAGIDPQRVPKRSDLLCAARTRHRSLVQQLLPADGGVEIAHPRRHAAAGQPHRAGSIVERITRRHADPVQVVEGHAGCAAELAWACEPTSERPRRTSAEWAKARWHARGHHAACFRFPAQPARGTARGERVQPPPGAQTTSRRLAFSDRATPRRAPLHHRRPDQSGATETLRE